jgi:DNA polymerase-3 subunit beta
MRLTLPQANLLKTLQTVERAVNERSTLPILTNVLLEAAREELVLTATDLDVGIQCRFPLVAPVEQGAVAIPARKLTSIVRELPEETVTLEAKKNHAVTLNCGASSFRIPGLPAEDFPALPTDEEGPSLLVPEAALHGLVTRTAYAMSMEETRFILNGALLTAQKGTLTMVTTDGRRLAVADTALAEPLKQPVQAVIPAKTVRELGRLLSASSGEAVRIIPLKEHQWTFRFGAVTVVTRLVEGQFPQYEKVIPPSAKHTLACAREELMSAIRRASLMTTAASQAVMFDVAADRLVVSKESAEAGSAREEIGARYGGEPLRIAFNPEFWLDVLKVLDSETVEIELSGADRPAVIRRPAFTYLVLPMKVA